MEMFAPLAAVVASLRAERRPGVTRQVRWLQLRSVLRFRPSQGGEFGLNKPSTRSEQMDPPEIGLRALRVGRNALENTAQYLTKGVKMHRSFQHR